MGIWENPLGSPWIQCSNWVCCSPCTLGWDIDPWNSFFSWTCYSSWSHYHFLALDLYKANGSTWDTQRVPNHLSSPVCSAWVECQFCLLGNFLVCYISVLTMPLNILIIQVLYYFTVQDLLLYLFFYMSSITVVHLFEVSLTFWLLLWQCMRPW